MNKIFIAYGDKKFYSTLKRIRSQARALKVFDKVIIYTYKDLNTDIKDFVNKYPQKGGYWIWKPYLILKTLRKYPDSVVVYADAGCSLNDSKEWSKWFELMQTNDLMITHYRVGYDYGWRNKFFTDSVSIETWTRRSVMDFFDDVYGHKEWHNKNKVWAGFMMTRAGACQLLEEWFSIMFSHPEFLVDIEEASNQYSSFVMHRHDQSILSALVYYYIEQNKMSIALIPETAESEQSSAVVASRIRTIEAIPIKTHLINWSKKIFGEDIYEWLHFWN